VAAIPSAVVPESSGLDPVVAAVRAELDSAAALAGERNGLAAAALALAAI
jgi:hypothetical protein